MSDSVIASWGQEEGSEGPLKCRRAPMEIPVKVLERTSGPVASELSSSEYWQEWFNKTLESSAEAKRANAFREVPTYTAIVTESPSGATTSEPVTTPVDSPEKVAGSTKLRSKESCARTWCYPSRRGRCGYGFGSFAASCGRKAIQKEKVRGVAREAVYRMLKEAAMSRTERTVQLFPILAMLKAWARPFTDKLRPKCHEDASHYVEVVHPEHPPPDPPPKRGLMNVTVELAEGFRVRDDGEDGVAELPRVVQGGRSVMCAVVRNVAGREKGFEWERARRGCDEWYCYVRPEERQEGDGDWSGGVFELERNGHSMKICMELENGTVRETAGRRLRRLPLRLPARRLPARRPPGLRLGLLRFLGRSRTCRLLASGPLRPKIGPSSAPGSSPGSLEACTGQARTVSGRCILRLPRSRSRHHQHRTLGTVARCGRPRVCLPSVAELPQLGSRAGNGRTEAPSRDRGCGCRPSFPWEDCRWQRPERCVRELCRRDADCWGEWDRGLGSIRASPGWNGSRDCPPRTNHEPCDGLPRFRSVDTAREARRADGSASRSASAVGELWVKLGVVRDPVILPRIRHAGRRLAVALRDLDDALQVAHKRCVDAGREVERETSLGLLLGRALLLRGWSLGRSARTVTLDPCTSLAVGSKDSAQARPELDGGVERSRLLGLLLEACAERVLIGRDLCRMTPRWLSLAERQGGKSNARRHGGERELRSWSPETIDRWAVTGLEKGTFVNGITIVTRSVRLSGASWNSNMVSSVVGFGVDLITGHAWELVAVACGILVWTVTEPLRRMVVRLFPYVGYFVYKWASY
ncbi:hypothetical protein GQ600_9035 [Phytophthora cactorum]|nr:hypothetical protein GQ600_9035 [Phytophthora cactorum]